jgi:hypothetical protein
MEKKKLRLFHSRTLDCFPGRVHIAMNEDQAERLKFFKKASGIDDLILPEINEWSHATFTPYKGQYFFQFPQLPRGELSLSQWAGLIAHEATHYTWYLEQDIGDLFDFNIQEPQCYLIQVITQDILDLIIDFVKENKELSFKENS